MQIKLNLENVQMIGDRRIVEEFIFFPRKINGNKFVWLQKIKVEEVYEEVASYDLDYCRCSFLVEKKWIPVN